MHKINNISATLFFAFFLSFTWTVVPSCERLSEDQEGVSSTLQEISFGVSSEGGAETRGLVEGATLYDSATDSYRPLYVTAYLHAQHGSDSPYFTGECFSRDVLSWKHTPSLYWPIGGVIDFIAYSAASPFLESDVIWGAGNSAERMRLHVGADRTQDDILFGSVWHAAGSPGGGSTDMTLYHSQARIDVTAVLSAGAAAIPVVIKDVILRNTYLMGVLNIENNYGSPTYAWDFRSAEARNRSMEDLSGVYGSVLTSSTVSVGMLIPEQPMQAIEVHYSVGGVDDTAVLPLSHGTWIAGRRYVYSLLFDPVARSSSELKGRIELTSVEIF